MRVLLLAWFKQRWLEALAVLIGVLSVVLFLSETAPGCGGGGLAPIQSGGARLAIVCVGAVVLAQAIPSARQRTGFATAATFVALLSIGFEAFSWATSCPELPMMLAAVYAIIASAALWVIACVRASAPTTAPSSPSESP